MQVGSVVKNETKYIAAITAILTVLMQAVFLVLKVWDWTVLVGGIFGAFFAVLNFFLLGLTVQKAVKKSEDDARKTMKASQTYRNLMILVVALLGIYLPCFNMWSVIVPLLFPRIAIALRPAFDKKQK